MLPLGHGLLDAFTQGNLNVAVGYQALSAETIGVSTVAIGDNVVRQQIFGSNGTTYNTLVGSSAGFLERNRNWKYIYWF